MQSLLSPEKILRSRPVPPSSLYNFMSGGGTSTAASSVSSAVNNIVKFSSAGVRPNAPNISSVIDNISTNVNNVETQNITRNVIQNTNKNFSTVVTGFGNQFKNIVGNIQKQVQSTLQGLIENFKRDYQQRIQGQDANRPSNVLKNFLGLYQNAINLVTFFGDERNHRKIVNSLKTLRKVFNESFDVAVIIRQTISRIVKQLSNLPTASATSPDLNIDVKVPGDRLKQSGGRSIGGFARSKFGRSVGFAALGAGALALGTGAASYGMERARQFQEEKLRSNVKGVEKDQSVPEGFLDGLNNIISRFTNAVEKLVGSAQKTSGAKSQAAASSSAGNEQQQSGAPSASAISMDEFSPQDVDLMGRMIAAEAGVNGKPEDQATVMNVMLNRYRLIKSGKAKPSDFGVQGKTKDDVTLSDILSVPSQWQPLRDGRLEGISSQQGASALQGGISAGGNDPSKILQLGLSRGLSQENASTLAKSTFFYASGNTPMPGMPEISLPGGNAHKFQESRYLRLGSVGSAFAAGTSVPVGETSAANADYTQMQQPISSYLNQLGTTPAQSQAAPNIQYVQIPPNVTETPTPATPRSQGAIKSPPQAAGESAAPDLTGLMGTSNSENPYIFLPFSLGIIS